MGLLGRLFGGSGKKEPKDTDQRSKRGRAPSIRQVPPSLAPSEDEAPLPEINLDDIDQQQAATKEPAVDQDLDPIPVDFQAEEAAPAAPEAPPAPPPPAPKTPTPAPPTRKDRTTRRVATPSSPRATRRSTRLQSRQKPIGEILIQSEAISTEQLTRALKVQDKGGKGLVGQILVNIGACQPTHVAQALGRQFRISTVELDRVEIAPEIAALVPEDLCRQHRLIPFEKLGKLICLAMANCLNRKAINQVEEMTKLKVKPFNCSWVEIRDVIEEVYSREAVKKAAAARSLAATGEETAEDVTAQVEAAAVEIADDGIELPGDLTGDDAAPSAPAPTQAEEEEEELRPFTGPARALIEGLDDLDGEGEVVKTTERGLASRHLEAIQARRAERAKVMGDGKGITGKLIAPDLDKFFAEGPDVIDLRQVDEGELEGVELPVAAELAATVGEFAEKAQAAAEKARREAEEAARAEEEAARAEEEAARAEEEAARAEEEAARAKEEAEKAAAAEAAAAEDLEDLEELEVLPAHGGDADHDDAPQLDTVAAAGAVAEELPAIPSIDHTPVETKEMLPIPVSDDEWAKMEEDLEPDPVVAWEATYAAEGPVQARQSLI